MDFIFGVALFLKDGIARIEETLHYRPDLTATREQNLKNVIL